MGGCVAAGTLRTNRLVSISFTTVPWPGELRHWRVVCGPVASPKSHGCAARRCTGIAPDASALKTPRGFWQEEAGAECPIRQAARAGQGDLCGAGSLGLQGAEPQGRPLADTRVRTAQRREPHAVAAHTSPGNAPAVLRAGKGAGLCRVTPGRGRKERPQLAWTRTLRTNCSMRRQGSERTRLVGGTGSWQRVARFRRLC